MFLTTKKFPNFRQTESRDCGPTCLRIVAKYYKQNVDINFIREVCETTREGTSIAGLCAGAERIGFRAIAASTNIETLEEENIFPCIVHWNGMHYVVVYKITRKSVYISDPGYGLMKLDKENE